MLTKVLTRTYRVVAAILLLAMTVQVVASALMPCQFDVPVQPQSVTDGSSSGCHANRDADNSHAANPEPMPVSGAADCQQTGTCCAGACGSVIAADSSLGVVSLPLSYSSFYLHQHQSQCSGVPFRPPIAR